jgi:hypothetical protein
MNFVVWLTLLSDAYVDTLVRRLLGHQWAIQAKSNGGRIYSGASDKVSGVACISITTPAATNCSAVHAVITGVLNDLRVSWFSVIVVGDRLASAWSPSNISRPSSSSPTPPPAPPPPTPQTTWERLEADNTLEPDAPPEAAPEAS